MDSSGCNDRACLIAPPMGLVTNSGKCKCAPAKVKRFVEKAVKLANQLPDSEDPGACMDCSTGKHMKCTGDNCTCEFCNS